MLFSMWIKYMNPEHPEQESCPNTVNSFRYENCFYAETIRAVESIHTGKPV